MHRVSSNNSGFNSLPGSSSSTQDWAGFETNEESGLRFFQRWWKYFSLFGVNTSDPTPRVWGREVPAARKGSNTDAVTEMVRGHVRQEEMQLMLRDSRVPLMYLDIFLSDAREFGDSVIRVFSFGAHVLEHMKIVVAAWTVVFCTAAAAFWPAGSEVEDVPYAPRWLRFDLGADVVYTLLLILELRTSLLDAEVGRECCCPHTIRQVHWKSKFFWCDVLSLCPIQVVFAAIGIGTMGRILILIKALRIWRIFHVPPRHVLLPSAVFQVFRLALFCLIGGHLLACMWFVVSSQSRTSLKHQMQGVGPEVPTLLDYYALAANTGMYLLVGIEREAGSLSEHIFLTICAPLGAMVHAYVFGEIILLIQRRVVLKTMQHEQDSIVRQAMSLLDLEPWMQVRIHSYFTFERLRRNAKSFEGMFRRLSPQLRFEIQLYLYTDLVANTDLLRRMKPRIIREIVCQLKDLIFLPGDYVCHYKEHGDSMYFIVFGKCTVLGSDHTTNVATLTRGNYFGEVALLTGMKRTAYVRSDTFCVLAHLTKADFEPIIFTWPEEIDVLIGSIKTAAERDKIKSEAQRHYGLNRRTSRFSNAGMSEAANTASSSQDLSGYNMNFQSNRSINPVLQRETLPASLAAGISKQNSFSMEGISKQNSFSTDPPLQRETLPASLATGISKQNSWSQLAMHQPASSSDGTGSFTLQTVPMSRESSSGGLARGMWRPEMESVAETANPKNAADEEVIARHGHEEVTAKNVDVENASDDADQCEGGCVDPFANSASSQDGAPAGEEQGFEATAGADDGTVGTDADAGAGLAAGPDAGAGVGKLADPEEATLDLPLESDPEIRSLQNEADPEIRSLENEKGADDSPKLQVQPIVAKKNRNSLLTGRRSLPLPRRKSSSLGTMIKRNSTLKGPAAAKRSNLKEGEGSRANVSSVMLQKLERLMTSCEKATAVVEDLPRGISEQTLNFSVLVGQLRQHLLASVRAEIADVTSGLPELQESLHSLRRYADPDGDYGMRSSRRDSLQSINEGDVNEIPVI